MFAYIDTLIKQFYHSCKINSLLQLIFNWSWITLNYYTYLKTTGWYVKERIILFKKNFWLSCDLYASIKELFISNYVSSDTM